MISLFKKWFNNQRSKNHNNNWNDLNVVWIHGANQTVLSFQYLRSITKFRSELIVEYDTEKKFYDNLEVLSNEIYQLDGPYFIVGHSLVGLYALYLTRYLDIAGAVSISTPFAGSWTADWARFFIPTYQLFKDVGRRSTPIKNSKNIEINFNWTQIISTKGSVP